MIRWYVSLLNTRPLLTSALSTGVLMGSGDAISQTFIEKRHQDGSYDLTRTLRFVGFGTLLGGPALRTWYRTLDVRLPLSTPLRPIKMMLLDQLLFAPTFILVFYTTMNALRGDNIRKIQHNLSKDYLPILRDNYRLWPATQLVNFYLVPLQYRVLVVNTVALGWNTYLAWKVEHENRK